MKAIREVIQLAYKFYSINDTKLKEEIKKQLALKMSEINLEKLKFIKKQESECYSLFVNEKLTFCYFYMKRGHIMPLHDHPNMTVFFKVLKGSLLLSQYQEINKETRKYKKISRIVHAPSEMMVLENGSWSMHKFLILSDEAVVLDVIGPPYDDNENKCSYFEDQSEFIPEENTNNSVAVQSLVKPQSCSRSQSTLVQGEQHSHFDGLHHMDQFSKVDIRPDELPSVVEKTDSQTSIVIKAPEAIKLLESKEVLYDPKHYMNPNVNYNTFKLPNGAVIPLDLCELVELKVVDIEYYSETSVFDVFAND